MVERRWGRDWLIADLHKRGMDNSPSGFTKNDNGSRQAVGNLRSTRTRGKLVCHDPRRSKTWRASLTRMFVYPAWIIFVHVRTSGF